MLWYLNYHTILTILLQCYSSLFTSEIISNTVNDIHIKDESSLQTKISFILKIDFKVIIS